MTDTTLTRYPESLSSLLPPTIAAMGDDAARAFLDFFTAHIRNPNTRAAYFRNVRRFLAWLDASGLRLETIELYHVATLIEKIGTRYSAPTVKQHLAALRMTG
jgi:integrase/recombinase XerD